jgi:MFS family permease
MEVPPPAEQRQRAIPTAYIAIGAVVALALAVGLVILILWLAQNFPAQVEAVRDVFIIALALESCVFGVVLLLLLIMLIRLINMLEFEIKPILEQTADTVGTVRGTTAFVSERVARPVVKYGGYLAAVRRGVQVLFGDPRKNLPD